MSGAVAGRVEVSRPLRMVVALKTLLRSAVETVSKRVFPPFGVSTEKLVLPLFT